MSQLRRGLRRRGSVRMRLALLFAVLFLLLGTIVIGVIFAAGYSGPIVQATVHRTSAQGNAGPGGVAEVLVTPPAGLVNLQRDADNSRLLAVSWIVLVVVAIGSIPVGWLASGWMLRPLREITARARTISAGNLHERLALPGAPDEFTELGDTLDDLLTRLETSFDAQRRFVANASHELRTPLTVERTLLQLALSDPEASAASLRATCEELLATGYDHERLLEAMLTLASSERGLERRERVELDVLLAAVLESPRPEIESHGLTVTRELEPAAADGDPDLITRLISNLVDNAVRHNVPGGQIRVQTAQRAGVAVITVQNSGQLISEDAIELMFEPFRRLGSPRIGSDSGQHGLGLSIVRAIANAHDAVIESQPRPDGGLTISVSFPAAVDAS